MIFNRDDPSTWLHFKTSLIAHDVGRTRDRSTAVVGGLCPVGPPLLGITNFHELPLGLYGSARANALAEIDREHYSNSLIVADLSNDATYGEVLFDTFGQRVIGTHIGRHGDGMEFERRQVRNGIIPVYHIGRTYLFELLLSDIESGKVRFISGPESERAYEQLTNLEVELRESGTLYRSSPGQHDDLAISIAMLNWFARHRHLEEWSRQVEPRISYSSRPAFSSRGWT